MTVLGWILFGLALWTVVAVVVVIPVCRVLGRRSRDYPAADKGSAWQAWQGRATRARMLLYRFCYGGPDRPSGVGRVGRGGHVTRRDW